MQFCRQSDELPLIVDISAPVNPNARTTRVSSESEVATAQLWRKPPLFKVILNDKNNLIAITVDKRKHSGYEDFLHDPIYAAIKTTVEINFNGQ